MPRLKLLIFYFFVILIFSCNSNNEKTPYEKIKLNKVSEKTKVQNSKQSITSESTYTFLNLKGLLKYQAYDPEIIPEILKYSLSEEIKIVRNEIFARKGYIFKDSLLSKHFNSYSWYKPKQSSIDSIKLSIEEKNLINSLIEYEKINKNLTIEDLKEDLRDIIENKKKFRLILWDRLINKGQDIYQYASHCFYLRYNIRQVDTVYNFYHCIISDWSGAEGPRSEVLEIYIIDKEINRISYYFSTDIGISNVKRDGKNKFKYDAIYWNIVSGEDEDGETEYKIENDLTYSISEYGTINFNK
jgi:hypothetical protein